MRTTLVASSAKPSCQWEGIRSRIEERRHVLERTRSMNVKRLQHDIQRIAKKEVEFVQKVVEDVVPVRFSWNQEAWDRLQEFFPVRVETVEVESESNTTEST